jgi:hypothetical protein
MTHSRMVSLNKSYRVGHWVCLLGLITVLTAMALLSASCVCVAEPGAYLTVENRFDFDITIVHEGIYSEGQHSEPWIMGVVPAGETVKTHGFMISSGSLGETVIIKAEDPSGNVVWEKSWPYDEFVKLKDVDWKIVIGPETDS